MTFLDRILLLTAIWGMVALIAWTLYTDWGT